jgi:hypothetical protein
MIARNAGSDLCGPVARVPNSLTEKCALPRTPGQNAHGRKDADWRLAAARARVVRRRQKHIAARYTNGDGADCQFNERANDRATQCAVDK